MVVRSAIRPIIYSARNLVTQPKYEYAQTPRPNEASQPFEGLATPRQLVQYLDEFIVGQENAKKVLSVAVFNHYKRVRANLFLQEEPEALHWQDPQTTDERDDVSPVDLHPHPYRTPQYSLPSLPRPSIPLFEKSNVLVIGPTGSGKTLLARTLARVLDVPFSVNDATAFTQAGYVGEDVEMCIQRLLQAAQWDPVRASMGIVYIDEIDKLARKASSGVDGSRDVGGEGVQQALLRMLEGSVVSVQAKASIMEAPPIDGRPRTMQRTAPKSDTFHIDTSNVLFILSGAFVGLDVIVKKRVAKGSIGFTANLASPSDATESRGFTSFFTPNRNAEAGSLPPLEPQDLVKFGFIPEFISRLPTITTLAPLTLHDLLRILTDVRGSLISQYTALFDSSGVEIRFTTLALKEICRKAAERGGGARGLRGIMESLLLDSMYEVPGSTVQHVLITDAVVKGEKSALYWQRGESSKFLAAWKVEEEKHGKE